jgi:hypothetical protein
MTQTLDLQPEIEPRLLARARAKGVSLATYAQEVLRRKAGFTEPQPPAEKRLRQFFRKWPLAGLEHQVEREKDTGREIVL